MKEYDVIIVGSGSGANLVENALAHDLNVALVDKGPVGGTCLNLGCIPTKMLIYPADRIMEIREAEKFGIETEIKSIDFARIMNHMRERIGESHDRMRKGLESSREIDFYLGEARFTGDYILEVNGQRIKGETIFLASGARPTIPKIPGLDKVPFLTNENVLQLEEKPESLIIVGGGYIAAEFAHFFSAMASRVTIIQHNDYLVPHEEPEISELLQEALGRRMSIHTGSEVISVSGENGQVTVTARDRASGEEWHATAGRLLLATGRTSNADLLQVEKTGVKTDEHGYIVVNDYLETAKAGIWAFGDAVGKQMFRHAANYEAALAFSNAIHGDKRRMDFGLVPHAVFTRPEIAAVGLTERQAMEKLGKEKILIGRAGYSEVARGQAMLEKEGFVKAVVGREDGRILGCHIVGPQASILIQEVVNAMAAEAGVWGVAGGMHIHPALPEVVAQAFGNLAPAGPT